MSVQIQDIDFQKCSAIRFAETHRDTTETDCDCCYWKVPVRLKVMP